MLTGKREEKGTTVPCLTLGIISVRLKGVSELELAEQRSLEGGADRPIAEWLSGTEIVPQQTIVAFLQLRPLDVGPQSSELLDLDTHKKTYFNKGPRFKTDCLPLKPVHRGESDHYALERKSYILLLF